MYFSNSYKGQDFQTIPYSKIRIFEGDHREVVSVFATFNLSAESAFAGKIGMIMGKLVRKTDTWDFQTIGEASSSKDINETIEEIKAKYL